MKAARLVFICVILLLLPGVALGGSSLPPQPDYFTTWTSDHFIFKYNPAMKLQLVPTLEDSMVAYYKVDEFFLGYDNKTTLVIAGDYNEFRIITGIGDIPQNASGFDFNDGARGLVAIKSPATLPNYKQVLTYHMARIAERTTMIGYHNPPEWFQDGLAAYVASDITPERRAEAEKNARTGKWMNLTDVEKVYSNMTVYNQGSAESVTARTQSFLLIEYVSKTYGNRTMVNILTDFGDNGNISQSFVNRTGQTPEKFNKELQNQLIGASLPVSPTPEPEIKEYISGYVKDGQDNPLAGRKITITGEKTNTTVTTDKSGYYAAEVDFGMLNVNMKDTGIDYNNTVPVNPGENKVYNITIPYPSGSGPGIGLPGLPSVGIDTNIYVILAIVLVNLGVLVMIIRVLRRNL